MKRQTSECDERSMARSPNHSFCCLRKLEIDVSTLRRILNRNIILPLKLVVPYCAGLCRRSDPNWNRLVVDNRTHLMQEMLDERLASRVTRCVPLTGVEVASQELYLEEQDSENGVRFRNITIKNFHINQCICSA